MTDTFPDWYKPLADCNACSVTASYAGEYTDYDNLWATCQRGDWLLWLLGKAATRQFTDDDRTKLVACVSECARAVTGHEDLTDLDSRRFPAAHGALKVQDAPASQLASYVPMAAFLPSDAPRTRQIRCWKQCADIVRKHYPNPPELPKP